MQVSDDKRCQQAAATILDLLKYQCQGFILPPGEVKDLLGLRKDDRSWYLNENVAKLRKTLARRYVAIEVNPIQGLTVMLYKIPQPAYVMCSTKSYRN
jgi:hypothetical protein